MSGKSNGFGQTEIAGMVVKTTDGEVLAKELKRETARSIELRSLNPDHPDRLLPLSEVAWIARILWASQ